MGFSNFPRMAFRFLSFLFRGGAEGRYFFESSGLSRCFFTASGMGSSKMLCTAPWGSSCICISASTSLMYSSMVTMFHEHYLGECQCLSWKYRWYYISNSLQEVHVMQKENCVVNTAMDHNSSPSFAMDCNRRHSIILLEICFIRML